MNKLNIGSSKNVLKDYVNIDIIPFKNINVVCDCEKDLPFKDNMFSKVYSHTVLEHLTSKGLFNLMRETARVCEGGGLVHHVVPFCRGEGAFGVDHTLFFNENSFDLFYQDDTMSLDVGEERLFVYDKIWLDFGRFPLIQWLLYKLKIFWCGGALNVRLKVKQNRARGGGCPR